MTSKNDLLDEPKTPHEEVMFVVESTNDIVSKILERQEEKKAECKMKEHCPFYTKEWGGKK